MRNISRHNSYAIQNVAVSKIIIKKKKKWN